MSNSVSIYENAANKGIANFHALVTFYNMADVESFPVILRIATGKYGISMETIVRASSHSLATTQKWLDEGEIPDEITRAIVVDCIEQRLHALLPPSEIPF